MSGDDLIARASRRAEERGVPESWGKRIALEEGEHFAGRWRGEAVDEQNDNRRIFLLWDDGGEPCFSRSYAALNREIDRAKPAVGETIVIVRGDDYVSANGQSGYSFGVETEPNDAPLPDNGGGDDIPF